MNSSCASAASSWPTVRRRQHRIAREREQRAHLALAWRRDLFGQRRHRQLVRELRQLAHARMELAVVAARTVRTRQVDGRLGEHHAALAIEVPRDRIQAIDQPQREAAELLRAGTHAPVDERARLGHQVMSERDDARMRQARTSREHLRVEPEDGLRAGPRGRRRAARGAPGRSRPRLNTSCSRASSR